MKKWTAILTLVTALVVATGAGPAVAQIAVCGDFNGDGTLNVTDVTSGMEYLFNGGAPAVDFDTADIDHLMLYTLHDAQEMLTCLFSCGPTGVSCAPSSATLVPVPDPRYEFGYENLIPAGQAEYGIRFGMGGEPVDLESFVAPLQVTVGGAPAAIDSIVFDSNVPLPASDIRSPGVLALATLSFPSGTWNNQLLGRIFVAVANPSIAQPVEMVWDTLTPNQSPIGQAGSVYPLFTSVGSFDAFLPNLASKCCWTAGDFDNDGSFNIADVTAGIARIFNGADAPACQDQADSNGDNVFNVADVTYGIARIFGGGPAPVCGITGA